MKQQTKVMMNRFLIYNLLATIYRIGPSEKCIDIFNDSNFVDELLQQFDNTHWGAGCRGLHTEVAANAKNMNGYVKNLQQEYQRLFIGPDHLEAPPWESVYLTREKLLYGEPTVQVRNFYQSFGLVCNTNEKEPEDHIGLEFAFMAQLCNKCAEKLAQGEQIQTEINGQHRFLQQHILQWVPQFSNDLQEASLQKFFVYLALFTLGWIETDNKYLEGIL